MSTSYHNLDGCQHLFSKSLYYVINKLFKEQKIESDVAVRYASTETIAATIAPLLGLKLNCLGRNNRCHSQRDLSICTLVSIRLFSEADSGWTR